MAVAVLFLEWSLAARADSGLAGTSSPGHPAALLYKLVRLAGLTAFTLVAFQVLTGPYMDLWESLYGTGFYRIHAYEGLGALVVALLHPALLLIFLDSSRTTLSSFTPGLPLRFYLGPLALLLMLATVSTAALAVLLNRPRFKTIWHTIHLANYAVFIFILLHSIAVGTDLASPRSPLRFLWLLFFLAMLVGFLRRRNPAGSRMSQEQTMASVRR